jgi:hypothetical protein
MSEYAKTMIGIGIVDRVRAPGIPGRLLEVGLASQEVGLASQKASSDGGWRISVGLAYHPPSRPGGIR